MSEAERIELYKQYAGNIRNRLVLTTVTAGGILMTLTGVSRSDVLRRSAIAQLPVLNVNVAIDYFLVGSACVLAVLYLESRMSLRAHAEALIQAGPLNMRSLVRHPQFRILSYMCPRAFRSSNRLCLRVGSAGFHVLFDMLPPAAAVVVARRVWDVPTHAAPLVGFGLLAAAVCLLCYMATVLVGWEISRWTRFGWVFVCLAAAACFFCFPGRARIRAPFQDLRSQDWAGIDLSHADLTGADLSGANLKKASMDGAGMFKATLVGANLEYATLTNACLALADLSGAQLNHAHMESTRDDATHEPRCPENQEGLRKAKLVGADLHEATLNSVDATGADFTAASLSGVKVDKADFSRARFDDAFLNPEGGAGIFSAARMRNATLAGQYKGKDAVFQYATLFGSTIRHATLEGGNWEDSRIESCRFVNTSSCETRFSHATITGTVWDRMEADRADFTNAKIDNVKFQHVSLQGADFQDAMLTNVVFREVNLHGAKFPGATFHGVRMVDVSLDGADFDSASSVGELAIEGESCGAPVGLPTALVEKLVPPPCRAEVVRVPHPCESGEDEK